ncbi:hypothetical protein RS130_19865 [Paraglaciecola aquimarina]|uniref:Uncharacterized protein n=1 Tax=Paraglaciecola aquimarina TaxID=1235557 RepID=A0ABU3T0P9_9ALTE|nr:hypothetical protein [Paraglaciecola aquimarina]MDU0355840.1 hypothetical protein [Paraglaciecola aquimarina]
MLPTGVAQAIAKSDVPKVYVPNLGQDPEQFGTDLAECIRVLIKTLKSDFDSDIAPHKVLNVILIDSQNGHYSGELPKVELKKWGIQLIDIPLVTQQSAPFYDNHLLANALLTLSD